MILGAALAFVAVASLALAPLAPQRASGGWRHFDASPLSLVAPSWSLARWEGVRVACVLATAALLWPTGLWPAGIVAAVVPSVLLRWRHGAIHAAAAARSLDILQAVHAGLRSGLPVSAAVRAAVRDTDPLAGDLFIRALRAFDLNVAFDDAARSAARQAHGRGQRLALEAIALVAREQLPAARAALVIASVADRLAYEARLGDEVRARSSGVRAQIILLALLVPALAAYLVATVPGLAATLTSPLGLFVLVPVAGVFELVGIVASRRIIQDVA